MNAKLCSFAYLCRLFLQLFYWTVKVGASKDPVYDLLPSYSYLWGFLWVPLALGLNELIRRYEIKLANFFLQCNDLVL